MGSYLVFLLSVFFGIGLFWIFKYKTKIKLFKYRSFFLKSLLILIMSNIFFWIYFFIQSILFNRIVQNSPYYEHYREFDLGGIVKKEVADSYNLYSPVILILSILIIVGIFIKGFIIRKKYKPLMIQHTTENKWVIFFIILSSILLIIFVVISMIMLVLSAGFKVSYNE